MGIHFYTSTFMQVRGGADATPTSLPYTHLTPRCERQHKARPDGSRLTVPCVGSSAECSLYMPADLGECRSVGVQGLLVCFPTHKKWKTIGGI